MLRLFIALLLVAVNAGASAATADYTPAERAELQKMVDGVRAGCEHGMAPIRAKIEAESVNATPAMLKAFDMAHWDGYCACVATEMLRQTTPALLRTGTEEQGRALVLASGRTCAVHRLQESYPGMCHALAAKLGQQLQPQGLLASGDAAEVDRYCRCAQVDIDALDGDHLDGFTKQTISEYRSWQQTGQWPPSTAPSLLGTMKRCVATSGPGATPAKP